MNDLVIIQLGYILKPVKIYRIGFEFLGFISLNNCHSIFFFVFSLLYNRQKYFKIPCIHLSFRHFYLEHLLKLLHPIKYRACGIFIYPIKGIPQLQPESLPLAVAREAKGNMEQDDILNEEDLKAFTASE